MGQGDDEVQQTEIDPRLDQLAEIVLGAPSGQTKEYVDYFLGKCRKYTVNPTGCHLFLEIHLNDKHLLLYVRAFVEDEADKFKADDYKIAQFPDESPDINWEKPLKDYWYVKAAVPNGS